LKVTAKTLPGVTFLLTPYYALAEKSTRGRSGIGIGKRELKFVEGRRMSVSVGVICRLPLPVPACISGAGTVYLERMKESMLKRM